MLTEAGSQLWHLDYENRIEIHDLRRPSSPCRYFLDEPLHREIHRALRGACSIGAIQAQVARRIGQQPENAIRHGLDWYMERGLAFEDGSQYVRLSTEPIPFRARPAIRQP